MKKLIPLFLAILAGIATLVATTVSYASWPNVNYQPKTPKSLIRED